MPPPIETRIKGATRWLKANRGKGQFHRAVYLVAGLCDEDGGCWETLIAHGRDIFPEWNRFVTPVTFPKDGVFAQPSSRAGQPMATFWDFGDRVREVLAQRHPDQGSGVGEYDVVCHSMGGLDTAAALVGPGSPAAAMAFNFIACDTPFRGIPSADLRQRFPGMTPCQLTQTQAIDEDSAELGRLLTEIPKLVERVERITCLRASRSFYVAVPSASADLLGQDDCFPTRAERLQARRDVQYRILPVPGSVHSGPDGLTTVRVGVVEIFRTLMGEV